MPQHCMCPTERALVSTNGPWAWRCLPQSVRRSGKKIKWDIASLTVRPLLAPSRRFAPVRDVTRPRAVRLSGADFVIRLGQSVGSTRWLVRCVGRMKRTGTVSVIRVFELPCLRWFFVVKCSPCFGGGRSETSYPRFVCLKGF